MHKPRRLTDFLIVTALSILASAIFILTVVGGSWLFRLGLGG